MEESIRTCHRRRFYGTDSSWERRTTAAVRRAMQHSQESLNRLPTRYSINLPDGSQLRQGLKTLKGLTPYQFICAAWQKDPDMFTLNPIHYTLGLNT